MPGSRQPIRALLVDYGEVLCEAPDPEAFAEMAHVAGVEPSRFGDAYWHLRPAYDRGELDGRTYWHLLGEEVGIRVDADLTAELVARDIRLWARLDARMVEWANAVAERGVPVGLLSNMVAEIGSYLRDTLQVFERFTSVTYSYEVGLAKPDARIYHRALESLGAPPDETLFVDDRVANVESARAVGLHAHHFSGHDALVADVDATYTFVPTSS
jgi:putative hydrolase of the HAD superfamily